MDEQRLDGKKAASYIKSRDLISAPGKYNAQVVGTPNPHNGRVIINFKAQTPSGLEKAKQLLRDGKFDDAANTNMTASVFPNQYVPSQGETVAIMVGWVENRKGEQVLGITSVTEIAVSSASKIDLGDEFANLFEEEATAESKSPELG